MTEESSESLRFDILLLLQLFDKNFFLVAPGFVEDIQVTTSKGSRRSHCHGIRSTIRVLPSMKKSLSDCLEINKLYVRIRAFLLTIHFT